MQASYRKRHLRGCPRFFVDAVGGINFGYDTGQPNWEAARHESFPEPHSLIERDYHLVREVEGARISVRRSAGAPALRR